ncbi:MAG: glycosyl hydrolase family 79 C-terminal domain-containing protein [Actinomycetota bacterium]|nr:glycosyl hydrolase family 79 C-terminal domain-containing protein [Actinomycetota bacterium]
MLRHGRLIGVACSFVLLLAGATTADASIGRSVLSRGATQAHESAGRSVLAPVLAGPPTSAPLPSGYLGLSIELYAIHEYTGNDPNAVNPILVQLIRNLNPGQAPILRIGGNSTDQSWWPVPGVLPPRGVDYPLTQGWIRTTAALANTLGAKLIVGINLQLDKPELAAVEGRTLLAGLGGSLQAFEIGNEPDLYASLPWYLTAHRKLRYGRPRSYNVSSFIQQASNVRHALPPVPIVGPSFAGLTWMATGFSPYLAANPGLAFVSFHRYPLRGCHVSPTSQAYPTVANLLSDYAQRQLAQGVAPYVATAHAQGLQFRVGEMNSVACAGSHGVSDTFASALWMLDTLFEMDQVGVDGVNIHTLPGARYELFSFTHSGASWQADVHPEYYGMLMFAQAAPPGSRLLPIGGLPDGPLKMWATLAPDGTERVVIINEDPSNPQSLLFQAPGSSATVEQLMASSVNATSGVTLGGQTFGDQTATGVLTGQPQASTVYPLLGLYSLTVPPGSATMLTLH